MEMNSRKIAHGVKNAKLGFAPNVRILPVGGFERRFVALPVFKKGGNMARPIEERRKNLESKLEKLKLLEERKKLDEKIRSLKKRK